MNYDAKCPIPECAKPWSEDFLLDVMPRTWMYKEYRAHREKFCLDQERARLPATQEHAKHYVESKRLVQEVQTKMAVIQAQIKALPESIALAQANLIHKEKMNTIRTFCAKLDISIYYDPSHNKERTRMLDDLSDYTQNVVELCKKTLHHNKEYKKLTQLLRTLEKSEGYSAAKWAVTNWGLRGGHARHHEEDPNKKQWNFTMKCPAMECQGFVGMDWTCGMCSVNVCKDCREVKDHQHVCDPAQIESVKALRKEAKPCPTCAAQISKIDGCDQMWCTLCHTAFSWKTGAIQVHVHNPHYYEWMRRTGQVIPRADAPRAAELECMTPEQILRQAELYFQNTQLFSWIQPISHMLHDSAVDTAWLNNHNENMTEEKKRQLRVKRLANEIDDLAWGKALELLNIQKRRMTDSNDIYHMFLGASTDIMRAALPERSNYISYVKQLEDLAKYTNLQIERHNMKYRDMMEKVTIPYDI